MEQKEDLNEIEAMKAIGTALNDLGDKARKRVLAWAVDKYDVQLSDSKNVISKKENTSSNTNPEEKVRNFEKVADLYFATSPETHAERALVIGYWFNKIKSKEEFGSQAVNSELRNLGSPISNITRAFNQLMKKSPKLVIQTRKTGTTKQARKKFKLTVAGVKKVEKMIEERGTARSH